MGKKYHSINIFIDSAIVIFMIISFYKMLTGGTGVLTANNLSGLKYFTVQSNIFASLIALISFIFLMINKDKAYPTWLAILKLTSTVGVSITFIVVLVYLMPLLGFFACLKGGNFFMHLVIPLTAIFQLIFFVPKKDFRWSFNFFSAFPVTIYGVFYMINIAIHDGYGIIEYDWYYFGAKGMAMGIIILVILIIASLGFSFLLYKIYRIPLKKKTAD